MHAPAAATTTRTKVAPTSTSRLRREASRSREPHAPLAPLAHTMANGHRHHCIPWTRPRVTPRPGHGCRSGVAAERTRRGKPPPSMSPLSPMPRTGIWQGHNKCPRSHPEAVRVGCDPCAGPYAQTHGKGGPRNHDLPPHLPMRANAIPRYHRLVRKKKLKRPQRLDGLPEVAKPRCRPLEAQEKEGDATAHAPCDRTRSTRD